MAQSWRFMLPRNATSVDCGVPGLMQVTPRVSHASATRGGMVAILNAPGTTGCRLRSGVDHDDGSFRSDRFGELDGLNFRTQLRAA